MSMSRSEETTDLSWDITCSDIYMIKKSEYVLLYHMNRCIRFQIATENLLVLHVFVSM